MEGSVSNYASAYKYTGRSSASDKKVQRVQRRSLEQRDLRHDLVNKRRNIDTLSPLHEGDATIKDRSTDLTPVKPKDDKSQKVLNRLEQLKKWKMEREQKKKEMEAQKKAPFRVKKITYKELEKKTKSAAIKKPPVRMNPPPKEPVTQAPVKLPHQKVMPPTRNASAAYKKNQEKGTVTKPYEKGTFSSRTRTTVETKKAPTTGVRQTRSLVKDDSVKQKNVSQPISRNSRHSKPAVTSETGKAPVRKTRQASGNRVVKEPEDKGATAVADLSKVTTSRGDEPDQTVSESFAPSNYTFTTTSFVFNPLSPSSAANFLFPGQDMTCSFLDHNPKISSTPKGSKRKNKVTIQDETVMENTVSESPKSTRRTKTADTSETDGNKTCAADIEQTVMCENSEMETNDKRQTSGLESKESETANRTLCDKPDKQQPVRRSSRKSVLSSSVAKEEQVEKPQTPVRKSSRRSVLSTTVIEEKPDEMDKENTVVKSEPRKSRSSHANTKTEEVLEVTTSARKKTRKSVSNETKQNELPVSAKETRRSTRRSMIMPVEKESIPETVHEDSEEDNVFVADNNAKQSTEVTTQIQEATVTSDSNTHTVVSTKTEKQSADKDSLEVSEKIVTRKNKFLSDGDLVQKTPGRKVGRSKNKSFGGFKLPDYDCAALSASAKRRGRKSVMPKSPEEWVDLFSKSPMIEMNRRTPRANPTPTNLDLNFDDFDKLLKSNEKGQKPTENGSETLTMPPNPKLNLAQALQDCEVASTEKEDEKENTDNSTESSTIDKTPVDTAKTETGSDVIDKNAPHDVKYFRRLLETETDRLQGLCNQWEEVNKVNNLTEEISGQIRTTVGQAVLLMHQRFKQFRGLVDDCEFKTGEKETTATDLDGFWDMIYFQVEDVDAKFIKLKKLQDNKWIDDEPKLAVKKVKKKVTKPTVSKPAVKSKFAAFRAQMKKKQDVAPSPGVVNTNEEEKVFEVPGFFTVASPVRPPAFHCEAGTPKKANTQQAESEQSQKENEQKSGILSIPSSGSDLLRRRTPGRKSYAPAVPSPLLVDSTPQPRPQRSCTKKTPMARQLLTEVPFFSGDQSKNTPRRSIRARKSVNFAEDVPLPGPANLSCSEDNVSTLIEPANVSEENFVDDDTFAKCLQPMSALYGNAEKENSPRAVKRRRSSSSGLKECPSEKRRKSLNKKVWFNSPAKEDASSVRMPKTPHSNTTERRVTRRSLQSTENQDIFGLGIQSQSPSRKTRSPRPSLLYTPPDLPKRSAVPLKEVPTATLISFTP